MRIHSDLGIQPLAFRFLAEFRRKIPGHDYRHDLLPHAFAVLAEDSGLLSVPAFRLLFAFPVHKLAFHAGRAVAVHRMRYRGTVLPGSDFVDYFPAAFCRKKT